MRQQCVWTRPNRSRVLQRTRTFPNTKLPITGNSFIFLWTHRAQKPRAITHVPPSERQVLFLHSGSNGLRYIEDIQEEELLDYPGDVQVSMVLGQFRPGNSDREFLKHVQSSQLRVDCVQSKPYRDILAPLAWCAMASLKTDQAGRLPSLDSLGFNSPNTMTGVTKILLPGGSGKLAVNLYVAKGNPVIEKILREALQLAPAVATVMNFPAVSVPALRTFSEIIGALEERSAFIMNSQLTHAVTTRQALADPDRPINYFQLIPGEYVLVPKLHIEELKPHLGDLQLQQGYLVDKDPAPVDPVVTRKDKAVPGVTYATLRISVNPAPGAPMVRTRAEGAANRQRARLSILAALHRKVRRHLLPNRRLIRFPHHSLSMPGQRHE